MATAGRLSACTVHGRNDSTAECCLLVSNQNISDGELSTISKHRSQHMGLPSEHIQMHYTMQLYFRVTVKRMLL